MRLRNYLKISFVLLVSMSLSEFAHSTCYERGKENIEGIIRLRGVITNLKMAKKYMIEESYLQLLLVPEEGGVAFDTDRRGRTVYKSKLPKTNIPSDGIFEISVSNLKPGRYVIVAQNLDSFDLISGIKPILSFKDTEEFIIISHPKDTKNKTIIDFGEVIIPIPKK